MSKLAIEMNSNSIPEGVSVFKYEITSIHLTSFYFKMSFSFFWNPCFSNLFSVSVLSLVKKVCVKRSSGRVPCIRNLSLRNRGSALLVAWI